MFFKWTELNCHNFHKKFNLLKKSQILVKIEGNVGIKFQNKISTVCNFSNLTFKILKNNNKIKSLNIQFILYCNNEQLKSFFNQKYYYFDLIKPRYSVKNK